MDQTSGNAAASQLDVQDPDAAGPPPWLVIEDEPPRLAPLPPDPLGDHAATEGAVAPWMRPMGVDDEDGAAAGQLFASMDPGLALTAELEVTDPKAVDLYTLVEMIAGYDRLESWAHSRVTELVGVLAGRPGINPHHPLPGGKLAADSAAGEIAPRLGISRYSARRIVHEAALFRNQLDQTAQAMRQGHIDPAKASALARLLGDQPTDVAWEVQRVVLPDAPHQTPSQLSRAAQKALIAIDPHRATQRHRRARDERRVDHPRPLPDGMASVHAVLPATDAAGLDLALEAAARSAKAGGDTRTIDQLRADALALLGHTALDEGYIGRSEHAGGARSGADAESPPEPTAGSSAAGQLVPRPTAADSGSRRCGEGGGGGGVRADDASIGNIRADDPGGADALQPASDYLRMLYMPVGTIGGRRAHVRITVPLAVLVLPPESQAGFGPYGECLEHLEGTDVHPGDNSADPRDSATHPGDDSAHPRGRTTPRGDSSAHSEIGYPERAALDDEPDLAEVAELEGYGPITPDVARALAMSGGTWQRLVTDPLSGQVLDVGRTRYRPPAGLAEFVRARDRSCIVPGCSTPAHSCELDHIEPYPHGPTSAFNLAPLCSADHTIKTLGAFRLRRLADGSFQWTTPSGHTYQRDPQGRVTWVRHGAGPDTDADPPF